VLRERGGERGRGDRFLSANHGLLGGVCNCVTTVFFKKKLKCFLILSIFYIFKSLEK
jgi:hypothetical protein